jgi:hypothetical protein
MRMHVTSMNFVRQGGGGVATAVVNVRHSPSRQELKREVRFFSLSYHLTTRNVLPIPEQAKSADRQ